MLGISTARAGRPRPVRTVAALCLATMLLAGCHGSGTGGNGTGNQTMPGRGNPAGPGAGQQVKLHWANNAWKVSLNSGPDQAPASAHTKLDRDIVGPTMFTVDIPNNSPASFKQNGALDVWEGDNAKAQPKPGINSTQILGPIVMPGGKQLIFFDLNQGDPVTLNYQLNFDQGPPVDPIINNGGHN